MTTSILHFMVFESRAPNFLRIVSSSSKWDFQGLNIIPVLVMLYIPGWGFFYFNNLFRGVIEGPEKRSLNSA